MAVILAPVKVYMRLGAGELREVAEFRPEAVAAEDGAYVMRVEYRRQLAAALHGIASEIEGSDD